VAAVILDTAVPDERHALAWPECPIAISHDRREVNEKHFTVVGVIRP